MAAPCGLISLPLMSLAADGDCILILDALVDERPCEALTGGLLNADYAVVLFVLKPD